MKKIAAVAQLIRSIHNKLKNTMWKTCLFNSDKIEILELFQFQESENIF